MPINAPRALLGGITAGATRIAGQGLLDSALLTAFHGSAGARLDPSFARALTSSTGTVGIMTIQLLLGIATVFLYAAMRPRFGGGSRTAIGAGLATWAAAAALWSVTVMLHLVPWMAYLTRVAVALPISLVAALAGARLYRELDATGARFRKNTSAVRTTVV